MALHMQPARYILLVFVMECGSIKIHRIVDGSIQTCQRSLELTVVFARARAKSHPKVGRPTQNTDLTEVASEALVCLMPHHSLLLLDPLR